ncbi:MAG: DUF1800 domain-containing protein, partial [Thermomicrobiales bacterium]
MTVRDQVQLLLWRAGFGATPAQVDAATALGYSATVENVLAFAGPPPSGPALPAIPPPLPQDATPAQMMARKEAIRQADQIGLTAVTDWWANLMSTSAAPLQENLTLFWHNHFATSNDKVNNPPYMLQQNQLFRALGAGTFVDLLIAVSKDPAMLIWLDGQSNVKGHANENWSRESMELFTLGIGNYTEADVREAARACTGWTLAADGTVAFNAARFDSGTKTILGQTGNFGLDDCSRILAAHPETATHLCTKLFVWFVGDNPSSADLAPMLAAWNQTNGNIQSVLRALFLSAAFTPDRATTAHIKNPVAWTIGIVRGLGIAAADDTVANAINAQGMILFRPTNVGGWPSGLAWISPDSQ